MEKLEFDVYDNINDLMPYIDSPIKYKFSWTQDICWYDEDFEDGGKLIRQYWEDDDRDEFIKLYNSVYADKFFKVAYINIMKGPGAHWPEAEIETDFITVKELYKETDVKDLNTDIEVFDMEELKE